MTNYSLCTGGFPVKHRTHNSRFAKAGVSCFYDSEVLNSSFVHLRSLVLKIPAFAKRQNVVRYAKSKAIQNLIDRKKMKKENLYYLSGILLLALGSVSFYVILIYWLFAILILSGITLIAISDKKIWLKIVTIFIVPIISVFLFFLSLIVFSNEAI